MPGPTEAGSDFASVISSSQLRPDEVNNKGTELPDGFPLRAAPHHRVVDDVAEPDRIDGVTAYDFKLHREVFTLFRPWEKCKRCESEIKVGTVIMPLVGDYVCPHTRKLEYEKISDDILDGKFLFGSEQETSSPDGTVYISLRWYEKKFSKQRARNAIRLGKAKEKPSQE